MTKTPKTPKERAEIEVNKRLGKILANLEIRKRKLTAEIKKIDKLVTKIESGDIVPDGESVDDLLEGCMSSHSSHKKKRTRKSPSGGVKIGKIELRPPKHQMWGAGPILQAPPESFIQPKKKPRRLRYEGTTTSPTCQSLDG